MMVRVVQSFLFSILLCYSSLTLADPFRDGVVAYQQQEFQKALKAWLPLAESGHVLAQTLVGSMYAYGEGIEKDDKEAFKWLSLAANTGSAQAQYNLAILYENGFGVTADLQQARKWFKAAADQGREDAATRYAALTDNIDTPDKKNKPSTGQTTKQRIHVVLNSDTDELLGPPDYTESVPPLNSKRSGILWVNEQPKNHYTIQLAASTEPRLIAAFKNHINLSENYAETWSKRDSHQWYALIYGSYPTVRDAKEAISRFPDNWKTWRPWVKTFESIKHIKEN